MRIVKRPATRDDLHALCHYSLNTREYFTHHTETFDHDLLEIMPLDETIPAYRIAAVMREMMPDPQKWFGLKTRHPRGLLRLR